MAYLDLDGTLLGPGGSLLAGPRGAFSTAAVRALELLHLSAVPVVLVSGRSRPRLEAVGSLLGAAGVLPEMGALDAGYPTRPGQTVHEAIGDSGVPAALLASEPGLAPHPLAAWGREGSHVLVGRAGRGAGALVERLSGGALRLADNGEVRDDGAHVYHLLPAAAGKAAAVARDVASRGADPAACLAVGDSSQDLAIAGVVGSVAIVANGAAADAEVAARAAWVTRGAYADGVLEAVSAWLTG